MVYRNLDEFLIRLEQSAELIHISQPVSSDLEIAQITHQHVQKTGPEKNKVLWFDQVDGQSIPVVTNLFGTEKRMAWALGIDHLEELSERMAQLVAIPQNMNASNLLNRAGEIMSAVRSTNNKTSNAKKTAYTARTLDQLPLIRHWPKDPFASIVNAQLIIAMNPQPIISQRRIVRFDDHTIGVAVHPADQFTSESYPAAVILGGDPAVMWSTSMKLPASLHPYWLAGWLRRKPLSFTEGTTQPIQYVDDAEFVIEGNLAPHNIREVALLSHGSGFYQRNCRFYVIQATSILGRPDSVLPAQIISNQTRSEQYWQNKAAERLMKPILQFAMQEIDDIHILDSLGENPPLALHIRSMYPGQAHKIMYGLWGMEPFAYTKMLLIIDHQSRSEDLLDLIGNALHHWTDTAIKNIGLITDATDAQTQLGIRLGLKLGSNTPTNPPEINVEETTALVGDCWFRLGEYMLVIGIPQNVDTDQIIDQLKCSIKHHSVILIDSALMMQSQIQTLNYVLELVNWETDVEIENHRVIINLVGRPYEQLEYEGLS